MVLRSQFVQQTPDTTKVGQLLLASLDHAVGAPDARDRLIDAYVDNGRPLDTLSAYFAKCGEPAVQASVSQSAAPRRSGM